MKHARSWDYCKQMAEVPPRDTTCLAIMKNLENLIDKLHNITSDLRDCFYDDNVNAHNQSYMRFKLFQRILNI